MENNNTNEAITFGKIVENAVPGTQLVNTSIPEMFGVWTGQSLTLNGTQYGYMYNTTHKSVATMQWDSLSNWAIRTNELNSPMVLDDSHSLLAEAIGKVQKDYVLASRRCDTVENDLRKFKSNVQEALHNWAESSGLDQDDNSIRDFNEMMEELGLEGLKREYTAVVRVTYEVEITIEATSEENASYEIDNNLSEYIYDEIDVSYYDDYEIRDIRES